MRPEEFLTWVRAVPFRPFRVLMNSGRSYDVRHPELVRVLRTTFILFTPSEVADVYDRAEMVSLLLIERVDPLEAPAVAS